MNKKLVILGVAATAVFLFGKTSYAFATQDNVIEESNGFFSDNYSSDSFVGCSSGLGNMFDENENVKDREVFEQELETYLESGDITADEKEYYLSMYNQCARLFGNNDTNNGGDSDFNSGGSFFPSCH